MIWPFSRFLGRNLSNFCVGFLENLRHKKFILRINDLYPIMVRWKKYEQIQFITEFSFYELTWILPRFVMLISHPVDDYLVLSYLKVSKSQKQIMSLWILLKNELNSLKILSWVCLVHFLEELTKPGFAFEI